VDYTKTSARKFVRDMTKSYYGIMIRLMKDQLQRSHGFLGFFHQSSRTTLVVQEALSVRAITDDFSKLRFGIDKLIYL
jgi:hypothetical protein